MNRQQAVNLRRGHVEWMAIVQIKNDMEDQKGSNRNNHGNTKKNDEAIPQIIFSIQDERNNLHATASCDRIHDNNV